MKKNQKISFCYHPTTIVVIDDNQNFIDTLSEELSPFVPCKFYDDPSEAMHFFKEIYTPSSFIKHCMIQPDDETKERLPLDRFIIDFNLRLVRKEIECPERFQEVAIVIIDYAMPQMNGLDLSRRLKEIHPMLQIILLTGEADEYIAIDAFNEGIIDQYIKKLTPGLPAHLVDVINQLQHNYFFKLSQILFNKVNETEVNELERLQDPVVIDLFNKIEEEHHIIEYYLLENNGNFLMVDKEGNPYWFALLTSKELYDFYDYVKPETMSEEQIKEFDALRKLYPKHAEKPLPQTVLTALKNNEKVPFFFSEDDLQVPPWEWEPYLHQAQELRGDSNIYYYALIQHPSIYEWPVPHFISYQHYLKDSAASK